MLYLEDYLEMIEHLPQELRDRFTEMRELDLSVQNNMDTLEKRVRLLFGSCRRGDVTTDNANEEFRDIRSNYDKTLEDADEKLQLANQVYELVERYLRRLDTELYKFKCELEADNKGITELLEKRSLELDAPTPLGQSSQTTHHKENRYRVRAEKRRESWGGSGSAVTGTMLARGSDSSGAGLGIGAGVGMGLGSGVPSSGGSLGLGGGSRSAEGRTLVAATAPHALSRTDSAIQAALGRGVTEASSPSYSLGHMGAGNAIAAAASQAIAATQQMQQGRRTASLKASYEAIHCGVSNSASNAGVGGNELQVGRELAGAAQQALHAAANNLHEMTSLPLLPSAASHVPSSSSGSSNKRHKKKSSYGGSSSNMLHSQLASLASSVSRSSSPTSNVGSVGVSNAAPITSMPLEEPLTDGEWTYDPNEPRYCICNQVSYGDMVACDNEDCPYEWFHYPCVSITAPPKGKWFCPQCQANSRRRGNRKN